jgi:hypothetical protein
VTHEKDRPRGQARRTVPHGDYCGVGGGDSSVCGVGGYILAWVVLAELIGEIGRWGRLGCRLAQSQSDPLRYVHTPTHGYWLNLIETLFGKMAHTFLRHIRVESWSELRSRILKGIEEINAAQVVHRWKKFDLLDKPEVQ